MCVCACVCMCVYVCVCVCVCVGFGNKLSFMHALLEITDMNCLFIFPANEYDAVNVDLFLYNLVPYW